MPPADVRHRTAAIYRRAVRSALRFRRVLPAAPETPIQSERLFAISSSAPSVSRAQRDMPSVRVLIQEAVRCIPALVIDRQENLRRSGGGNLEQHFRRFQCLGFLG